MKLSINKDKSRVVNLKTGYSEFLGFKFKLYRKSNKWVVKSHIRDKTIKRIKNTIKGAIKLIQYGSEDSSNILNFNRTILGVHNYYRIATNVNVDFNKIAFHINKTLKIRLRDKYKKKGTKNKLFLKYYSDYQGIVYYIDEIALFPVAKVTNKPPMCFTQEICNYTKEGRMKIHKSLKGVKQTILYYLMDNPIKNQTVEYNDNRISLYVGQNGLCAITKEPLQLGLMHAHHITPKFMGGTDKYQNLIFVTDDIHRLIHIKDKSLIEKYMMKLNISRYSLSKLNKLRDLIGNCEIQLT